MDKTSLSELLRKIRKFEKGPQEEGIRIAVLGSFSVQYFVKFLRYFLAEEGIGCTIYEGEYDGINMEVFDAGSGLYRFRPEYVILLPYYTDVRGLPPLLSSEQETEPYLDSAVKYYVSLWEHLGALGGVRILQSNIVVPPVKVFGNLERQIPSATCNFLGTVNSRLVREKPAYVTIVDADELSGEIGKNQWFDMSAYFLNKAGVRLDYLPEFVGLFVRQIRAMRGNTKKCLVLDLDNTLWGGVVGDDGWDGIQIDPNHAMGEAYRFFQNYVLALKNRGIILAVCSKNDEAVAKEPFEKNENMILRLDDFSCFVANWDDKATNLRRIAAELNIGMDSLVFFDDNPAEREIVRRNLPEVQVIDVPEDPALYVYQMNAESPFEWLQITKEDLDRTKSYRENIERRRLQESFVDYDEYLQALEMRGCAAELGKAEVSRFTQLINKSNQFNLRTVRYTESDILEMTQNEDVKCLYAKLSDKYSDYGIISCVILKRSGDTCFIDTWVMSCRVLKRGVEYMMFGAIVKSAREWGCKTLRSEYIRTKKNAMVEDFYASLGFSMDATEGENGERKEYTLQRLENNYKYFIKEQL